HLVACLVVQQRAGRSQPIWPRSACHNTMSSRPIGLIAFEYRKVLPRSRRASLMLLGDEMSRYFKCPLTPESDIKCDIGECPLWAKSRHRRLLDYVVGCRKKRSWKCKAERRGGLEVDE